MSAIFDIIVIVIGGGLLGSAIGFGLTRLGLGCAILDEGDTSYRAAHGNFGLVWVQSKGIGFPVYSDWTMRMRCTLLHGFFAHNNRVAQNGS